MEEDISPWRQTEHDETNHPHRLPPPPIPSKGRPPQPTACLQFDFDSGAGKGTGAVARGRQATLDPVIVSPELFRSRSIREVALPRLPDKTDGLLERRGSFRSTHLLPLAKSLSKGET
jgi:hypothetical protein